jgi:hypothetical protein
MSDLAERYLKMPDDEIIRLYGQIESLTDEAKNTLRAETVRRGITDEKLVCSSSLQTEPTLRLKDRPSRWASYWPSIEDSESATKALHNAGWCAAIQAAITGILALVAIKLQHPVIGLDGWSSIDTALLAITSWRLFKLSYGWAIFATIYQFANVVQRLTEGTAGIAIGIIFLLAYISAFRGGAYLRKHRNDPVQGN